MAIEPFDYEYEPGEETIRILVIRLMVDDHFQGLQIREIGTVHLVDHDGKPHGSTHGGVRIGHSKVGLGSAYVACKPF